MNTFKAKKNLIHLLAFSLLLMISACVKEIDPYTPPDPNTPVENINDLVVPSSFKYELNKNVQVNLKLLSNTNSPINGVKIRFMDNSPEKNGQVFFTAISDNNGNINSIIKLPSKLTKLVINTSFIGLVNNAIMNVTGPSGIMILGGSNPQHVDVVAPLRISNPSSSQRSQAVPTKNYLGTWDNDGVPNYLESTRDNISSAFLTRINNSVPEYESVPSNHPEYIASGTQSTINLNQTAQIWMTFVHEGAGYKNTIGYYIYNKNNPPSSTNDISKLNIVFPNLSYLNSGGGLVSGDKVYIGTFGADTTIGFVLLSNAYSSSNKTVGNGYYQYYSNNDLNPESNSSNRAHNVLLWDSIEQKMVIAFEDLNREGWCDNDFNDAIFYVTSNPANAINNNGNTTGNGTDTDGDGVVDTDDEYPNDANLAYNSYYPSNNLFGHLAFEDLWPTRGDFDFNDLIVGYKFNSVKNASNLIAEVDAEIYVKAVGGSYQNGFGFELPIPPAFIQSVSGTSLKENYISLNGNGTESGQHNSVIIAFDNALNLTKRPAGYYVNTQIGSPIATTDTLHIKITFVTALSPSSLGDSPFNPFMISNLRRGYEIHLADRTPTDKADMLLFNTGSDRSNAVLGRYYKSDKNLPWALNIPNAFPIVVEKSQITSAYTKFQSWAVSNGELYQDWYEDKPGYRNTSIILIR